jgi:glycerol-3-phosphate acyltransferase PlsY
MSPWLLTLAAAYLLGSIPFGYLLVRIFRHQDIRDTGSGNTGATNVAREAKGLGLLTLALDLAKAVAAVLLARHVLPGNYDLQVAAAVAVILGHVYPVWLAFRGGKGVACALGVFLVLSPKAALGIFAVFLLVVLLTRFVSLASVLAAASFPLFAFYFIRNPSPAVLFGFLFIPALIIWKHRANIARLLAHTEPRFGKATGKSPAEASA